MSADPDARCSWMVAGGLHAPCRACRVTVRGGSRDSRNWFPLETAGSGDQGVWSLPPAWVPGWGALHPWEGCTGLEAGAVGAPEDTRTVADGKGEACLARWDMGGRKKAVK